MKLSKFHYVMISIGVLLLMFILIPVVAPMFSSIPFPQFNNDDTEIVDPLDTYNSIQSINEATYSGELTNPTTFQTIYSRGIKSCNTYTLKGGLELYEENNGLMSESRQTTLETYEPTAITCIVDASVLEGSESEEVVVALLDYNQQNGEYTEYSSDEIELVRQNHNSGLFGFF